MTTTTMVYRGIASEFKPFYQLLAVQAQDSKAILEELTRFEEYAIDGLKVGLVCPKGRAILQTDEAKTKTRVDFVKHEGWRWVREKFYIAAAELGALGNQLRTAPQANKIDFLEMFSGKAA